MVAVPLIFGRLTTEDYTDAVAADPRIDALREKVGGASLRYRDYWSPDIRNIPPRWSARKMNSSRQITTIQNPVQLAML